jgi:hypothetical protein
MSGRGFVDFVLQNLTRRTHTQLCILKQASPVKKIRNVVSARTVTGLLPGSTPFQ